MCCGGGGMVRPLSKTEELEMRRRQLDDAIKEADLCASEIAKLEKELADEKGNGSTA